MTLYKNDINILILNSFMLVLGVIIIYYSRDRLPKYCILQYMGYGIILLPVLYLLIVIMGFSTYVPKEIGYIFLAFGLFYIPYVAIGIIPDILFDFIGLKSFIEDYFNKNYKLIEFGLYIFFWAILFMIAGYLICNARKQHN